MGGEKPEFSVEFSYTEGELRQFQDVRSRFLDASKPQESIFPDAAMAMGVALAGAAAAVLLGVTTERQGGVMAILLLATYATGTLNAYRRQWRLHRKQEASQRRQAMAGVQAQHCRMWEGGVVQRIGQSEAQCGWEAFDKIWSEAGLLFLMVRDGRGFPIPIRAFASPGEAEMALSFAQQRLAAAKAAAA